MKTSELDFHLPQELIAQHPPAKRSAARLLHYERNSQRISHRRFIELPELLRPDDLLVFNDSRVIPARFTLLKKTGGQIEGLFISEISPGRWRAMLKNAGRWKSSDELTFDLPPDRVPTVARQDQPIVTAKILSQQGAIYDLQVNTFRPAVDLLDTFGRMPLPPYIKRTPGGDTRDSDDRQRYQTSFARTPGSVAAPTAALHFDQILFDRLRSRNIQLAFITLHVGIGTFKPVDVADLSDHQMHEEAYTVDATAAAMISRAIKEKRRVIAVGTTSARVLESLPGDATDDVPPQNGVTSIFIRPPYQWRRVGALITNFHLPRSTLIALVASFVGLEAQRQIYATAIAERYNFFSFGDGSFLE